MRKAERVEERRNDVFGSFKKGKGKAGGQFPPGPEEKFRRRTAFFFYKTGWKNVS